VFVRSRSSFRPPQSTKRFPAATIVNLTFCNSSAFAVLGQLRSPCVSPMKTETI
jgi:hypothetical protein